MKLLFANVLALVISCACLMLPASGEGENGNVSVHVTGLNNSKGVVRIALFNSADAYTADKGGAEKSFKKAIGEIKNNESNYTFADVPYGDYAIKLYHDEDNSGTFYTGMFGIPKVQYGFSNNAKAMFGPPSYDKAKFTVNSKDLPLNIKLQG